MMLTMTNAQGVTVFTMKMPVNDGQYSNTMDITRFPRGIYYLKAGNKRPGHSESYSSVKLLIRCMSSDDKGHQLAI